VQSLEHLRVVDLSQVMAGPFCTMLLADHGADVVKVEPVDGGDSTRHALGSVQPWGESAAFLAVNRNKRGLALDLKSEEGRDVLFRLAADADVFVESYRPGTAARLGVGYDELAKINPRLVYASISGFGATGPYADRGGYDIITQGMSGIMSVTGATDGPPAKAGVPLTDVGAGMLCAFGVLAALAARERTGRGQQVDTSLFEAGLAYGGWEATELWSDGTTPGPLGSAHRMSAPYQAVRAADGHFTIGAFTDRLWTLAATALGHPEWLEDPRFATGRDRLQHRLELIELIELETLFQPCSHWLDLLHVAGVPAGPVNTYADALSDEQTLARAMVVEAQHPDAGTVRMLGIPVKLSDTPGAIRRPPPRLGEHTDEILGEIGYEARAIEGLRERDVVAGIQPTL
jgi:crotonobetainyl-CoA:carnitine CoA-transferase CaiB-like acyl-CoA transferase